MSFLETCYAKRTSLVLEIRSKAAYVLEGTHKGWFLALSVRVKGSRWVWHPDRRPGVSWWSPILGPKQQPSRHVRKAAKLALRHWLNESA